VKTFGFTERQLSAVVGCQATVTVTVGALVGIPLGIVSGRYLWDFADEIHAVPAPNERGARRSRESAVGVGWAGMCPA